MKFSNMLRVKCLRSISLIFTLVIVVGCSFGQDKAKFDVAEIRDIDYLEERSVDTLQKLNLVTPKGIDDYPLLIWIGGGAWSYVDRNVEMDLAKKIAQEGIAVASVGHRLSTARWIDSTLSVGLQHPRHIEDVASSVKWLYDNAQQYGYDTEKIFIGGFSSGAHIAALISMDETYLKSEGLSLEVIKGVIPVSGTYDIVNYHEVFATGDRPEFAELHVEAIFGETKEGLKNASPTTYLENLSAPLLLISDNALDQYTRLFEDRLKEIDFRDYEVIYVADLDHGELWRSISFDDSSDYRKEIVKFIKARR